MTLRALLGPDEKYEIYWEPYEKILDYIGYQVKVANSVNKMLEALKEPYDLVLMEINQGSSHEVTYEPALKAYRKIEENVMKGRTKFFAISDRRDLVKKTTELTEEELKKYGLSSKIPAMSKDDFIMNEFKRIVNNSKLKSGRKQYDTCVKSAPIAGAL